MPGSDRFNGFARYRLDDLLFGDLADFYVFNERDMHAAAYYYVRRYFQRKERHRIFVRCEPHLDGMKPDVVVYEGGNPIYAFEFKLFAQPDCVIDDAVEADVAKLHRVVQRFPTMRWGFMHVIYDADEPYSYSDARLRRRGFNQVSVTTINARRKEKSGRRRNGYDTWRKSFDRLLTKHREHA